MVFVADDDLWLVNSRGGNAHRITVDGHPPRSPRFSPNGQKIAFVSNAGAGFDLHVVDLAGERRRLTWTTTRIMLVSGWLDDDHVLVASDHADGNRALTSLYSVSLDGAMERLPWGPAMAAAVNSDGRVVVASPNFRGPEAWKRYRGGSAVRLWVSDPSRQEWQRLLPNITASLQAPAWFRDRILFTSDLGASLPNQPNEQAQIWSVAPDGSDLRAHTRHTFLEGYVRDATTDGRTIVYHSRGVLYRVDSLTTDSVPISVKVALPAPALKWLKPTEHLNVIAPDDGGDGSLIEWRGSAWYLTHRGGPARALSDLPGVRIREPQLLGNTGRGIWATDAEGDDCLEILALDGDDELRRIARGRLGRVLELVSNKDGTKVAVASHDGSVSVVGIARASVKKVGRSANGEASGLTFSPDGRYLIWREAVGSEGQLGRLVGYDLEENVSFELTRGQFNDFSPAFSLDGRFLYFLSSRTFDPTYDEMGFDLTFTNTIRPHVIPLQAAEPAPFGPAADGWNISEDSADDDKTNKPEDAEPQTLKVLFDLEGAESRMTPLPVPSGRYTDLQVTKNGVLWRSQSSYTGELGTGKAPDDETRDRIEFYDLTKRKLAVVVDGCDSAAVSGDGRQLVVRNGEEVWVQSAEARAVEEDSKTVVDLNRMRRSLWPRDEWRQMFDENARLMRDHFWREDMDGVDWQSVTASYRPLVETLASHDDLVDLLWETVGELNTSHAYVIPRAGQSPHRRVGWLGAEFNRNAKGELVIARILEGETSDPSARSPLRAAGVDAKQGDIVLAVDGRATADVPAIGALLQGTADQVIELTLARGRMKRRVAVVPVRSEASLRYHEWVSQRSQYVSDQSDGRVGYVHVPDMMAHGWAEFHRLIGQATRREAVLVDVRFNGGGHTSELIIERLMRRVIGWSFGRHFEEPMTYPMQGMRGPVAIVTNPYAGSDGDIVTAAAQNLSLGPVIGERSWGGVVGIDGRFTLVDGTAVTQPRYANSFAQHGFGLENHGTDPDIQVPMGPADWESAADIQLDRAIKWLLDKLKSSPAVTPPAFEPPRA